MFIAERRRTPLLAAALAAAVFAVYAAMTPSAVGLGDEAEAQTVPYILGIAHPTGFPLYVLAGWVWSHVIAAGVVAWRLNLFDAFCSALTAGGVFLLGASFSRDRIAAALAALAFAFGGLSWTSALHANAQVVASTLTVFVLVAAVAFARSGERRMLVVACLANGLALAAHPNAMWTLPAIAVAALWQRRALTARACAVAVLALALPLSLYAYLPIRSAVVAAQHLDPNAGPPLFGAGRLVWDVNSPRTLDGFLDEVLGRAYSAGAVLGHVSSASTLTHLLPYWLSLLGKQYHGLLLVLAGAGLTALARNDRRAFTVVIAGTIGGIAFMYDYRGDAHIDRYAVLSFAVVAALAANAGRIVPGPSARVARTIAAVALTAVVAGGVVEHRPYAAPLDRTGLGVIAAVEADIPDGAIVVAQWEQATPLAYASFVSHTLGKRTVVTGWAAGFYADSLRWARVRPTYYFLDGTGWSRLYKLPPTLKVRRSDLRGYAVVEVVPTPTR